MRLLPPMKSKLFILLQHLLPQHLLSRLCGIIADWHAPKWLLQPLLRWFVAKYQIDMQQAELIDLESYASFNQFFTRKLAKASRAIGDKVISPADGTISEFGDIKQVQLIQAKGIEYCLINLLANKNKWIAKFTNGSFITIYLSPRDYHRVHMPYSGKLLQSMYVPGKLFSVNPTTVNNVAGVFARNERLISIFQTDKGYMAVILVGAMLVAGIQTSWQGKITPNSFNNVQTWDYQQQNITLNKGDELGYFNFGSTVIVLFSPQQLTWHDAISAGDHIAMGENIGQ